MTYKIYSNDGYAKYYCKHCQTIFLKSLQKFVVVKKVVCPKCNQVAKKLESTL